MIRATKTLAFILAASAGLSCFPGRFDDLEKETWVQFIDRDNGELNGDIGLDVAEQALPAGTSKGGSFVVSSQGAGGLLVVTVNETGDVGSRVGSAGLATVSGGIPPLNDQAVYTVAPYVANGVITGFVAGQPRNLTVNAGTMQFNGVAAVYLTGPKGTGTQVKPSGVASLPEFGNDIVVGDFGSGAATPDIIVLGAASITVQDGAGNARTCRLLRPNFPPAFAMGFKNAALAPILGNGHNQLVVSGVDDDNSPKIYVFEPGDIVESETQCPATRTISLGAVGETPPITLAIGKFSSTTALDLVTGTSSNVVAGTPGTVKIYPSINVASPGTPQVVTAAAENPSTLFGARILLDDLDGDGQNELIVSDPSTAVGSTSDAGKVYIYTPGGGTCANSRGPVCLRTTLSATEPGAMNHYGRGLATTKYVTSKGTRRILGVGERNRLNVYFRVDSSSTEPREL